MAKKEHHSAKSAKKSKAKKRKHDASDEDEVANKSLILSQDTEEPPSEKPSSKQLKRKSETDNNETGLKKSKTHIEQSSDEAEELYEPTHDELVESEKPENVKSVVTVRQSKKQKHQQRLDAQKNQLTNKEITRNEEYLKKWKDNRDVWKFEKLRQISILQTVFDDSKLSKELWPIALEYLSGSKGAAKDKITKAAESIIDELDGQAERATDADPTTYTMSEKYRRARELLQVFD